MFHTCKQICDVVTGVALDPANGISAKCACVLPFYRLGTVQQLLNKGKPGFTHCLSAGTQPCLLFQHAVDMAKDVLAGLECMHRKKIVHRDIKPSNICVERLPSTDPPRLRYIIIDLGVAVSMQIQTQSEQKTKTKFAALVRQLSTESTESESGSPQSQASGVGFTGQFTSLASLKVPLGTVLFMSLEHIDDDVAVDARADVFSFGVTMYTCLCGRFPFVQPRAGEEREQLALRLVMAYASTNEADPLDIPCDSTSDDTDVPVQLARKLAEIVMTSLRKLRSERFLSASAMRAQIQRVDRCD